MWNWFHRVHLRELFQGKIFGSVEKIKRQEFKIETNSTDPCLIIIINKLRKLTTEMKIVSDKKNSNYYEVLVEIEENGL